MNQRCTTHFHACDCREEIFKELENKLAVAITSLKKCQEYSSSYETLTGMGAAILIETRKALKKIEEA